MELTLNIVLIIIIILFIAWKVYDHYSPITYDDVAELTDNWIREVTINHDSQSIYGLFCKDGNLVGTVSQVKRKGIDIQKYFDYFAKLPGIRVTNKKYN